MPQMQLIAIIFSISISKAKLLKILLKELIPPKTMNAKAVNIATTEIT